jgi:RNA polymerase sigma-70 factor (ECF subfamily)
LSRTLESEWTLVPAVEEAFTGSTIRDEQLRMMFSCCHPALPEEVQVALILNILCGFGAGEIASAFLISHAAMEKRISRGKKSLASSRHLFDLADAEFTPRLTGVRRALYVLFSEGYHGASAETAVRADLCREAIRLTMLLLDAPQTAWPETHALAALMHLHAAKLPARLDSEGDLNPLLDQDRSRWDAQLVARGLELLDRSAAGPVVSPFHVEAAIAAVHATASSVATTDWTAILDLYDRLMGLAPSPVVALNRAIAIGQRDGPQYGIAALRAIANPERLRGYPFYQAAFGEFELRLGNHRTARQHFAAAVGSARNGDERRFLERRVQHCDEVETQSTTIAYSGHGNSSEGVP